MKRSTFFILVILVVGMGMMIRTLFGGNGDNEVVYDENPGFIEEITNTGDVATTGNENTVGNTTTGADANTHDTSSQNGYTEIRVMMPGYLYTTGRKEFAEDLYNDEKIYMDFSFVNDLNEYRDTISNPEFTDADLMFFPYDWKNLVSLRTFTQSGDSIQSYFDLFVAEIFDGTKFEFRPFAVDPMILYSSVSPIPRTFNDISNLIYNRDPTVQLAFPIFFGISSEDEINEGFEWEYQDIVRYALLHYFRTYNQTKQLLMRIDTNVFEDSSEIKNYNVKDLRYIASIINKSECERFPSLCFQLWDFVGIRFGFMSDADIVHRYFPNKQAKFDNLGKTTVPFFSIESPVRLRGRGVSNNTQDPYVLNALGKFMKKYMNQHSEYELWNSTLSAFKSNDGDSLLNNHYIGSRGYILDAGGNFIDTLRDTKPFWQMIGFQISVEEYLSRSF